MDEDLIKEILKLISYTRCMKMATGYKVHDEPNLDNISRRVQCLRSVLKK